MAGNVKSLSKEETKQALAELPGWELRGPKLFKKLQFKDFKEAWSFMNEVASEAERAQHHPEWFNVYNRVEIELITHDADIEGGAITHKDIELARFINKTAD